MRIAINSFWDRKYQRDNPEFYGFHNAFKNLDIPQSDFIDHIKAGHSYCAQHKHVKHGYEADDGSIRYTSFRCQKNWLPTGSLSLDFDTGDKYSSFDYLLIDPIILNCASFLYSTTSSTQDKPRTRVVFITNEAIEDVLVYYDALCTLSAIYTRNDRSAKDIVKAYAGNKNANVVSLGNVLMLPALQRLIDQWKAKDEAEQRQKRAYFDSLPKTASAEEVAEMLGAIPATGLDYIGWVKILMAVHDVVPDERGIDLCESWCPGTNGEIEEKFRSFRNTTVTVAYLRAQAMKHGWQPKDETKESRADLAMRIMIASRNSKQRYVGR